MMARKNRKDRMEAKRKKFAKYLKNKEARASRGAPFTKGMWIGVLVFVLIGLGIGAPFWFAVLTVPPGGQRDVPLLPLVLGPAFIVMALCYVARGLWIKFRSD